MNPSSGHNYFRPLDSGIPTYTKTTKIDSTIKSIVRVNIQRSRSMPKLNICQSCLPQQLHEEQKESQSSGSKNKRINNQVIKERIQILKPFRAEENNNAKLQIRRYGSYRGSSHHGSLNQNNKIEPPSEESSSVNNSKKNKILLQAQQKYKSATAVFYYEYKAMKQIMETEDHSKIKDKLSLVQKLHHHRCKSLMSFKALEAQFYNRAIRREQLEMAYGQYRDCREQVRAKQIFLNQAFHEYLKVAGLGTQEEKTKKELLEYAKQISKEYKQKLNQLKLRLKQNDPSQWKVQQINPKFEQENEIQKLELQFKEIEKQVQAQKCMQVEMALHNLRASDSYSREFEAYLIGHLDDLKHSEQECEKAFDFIKNRKF